MAFFLVNTDHGKHGTEYRGDEKLTLGMIVIDFLDRQYSHKDTLGLLKVYKVSPEFGLCEDWTERVAKAAWQHIDANDEDCAGNELRLLKECGCVPDYVERIEGGRFIYPGMQRERSDVLEHSVLRAIGGRVA